MHTHIHAYTYLHACTKLHTHHAVHTHTHHAVHTLHHVHKSSASHTSHHIRPLHHVTLHRLHYIINCITHKNANSQKTWHYIALHGLMHTYIHSTNTLKPKWSSKKCLETHRPLAPHPAPDTSELTLHTRSSGKSEADRNSQKTNSLDTEFVKFWKKLLQNWSNRQLNPYDWHHA